MRYCSMTAWARLAGPVPATTPAWTSLPLLQGEAAKRSVIVSQSPSSQAAGCTRAATGPSLHQERSKALRHLLVKMPA